MRSRPTLTLTALLAATSPALASPAPQQPADPTPVVLRKVAATGDPAPVPGGTGTLIEFDLPELGADWEVPRIDAAGDVSFAARVTDPDAPSAELQVIYRERLGALSMVAAEGQAAPGTTGEFRGFPDLFFNASPRLRGAATAFVASSDDLPSARSGVWEETRGGLAPVALQDDQPPGTPAGAEFLVPGVEVLEGGGLLVPSGYRDPVDGSGKEQEGFWRRGDAGLELVVRDELAAPGAGAGVVFGLGDSHYLSGPFDRVDHTTDGRLAFNASMKGSGVEVTDDEALFVEADHGNLQMIVREGDPAPGFQGSSAFGWSSGARAFGTSQFVGVRVNEAGHVLFGAGVHGPSFDHVKTLWTTRSGSLELLATAGSDSFDGDPAPGLPGDTFETFTTRAELDDSGVVAFTAHVPDDDGDPFTFENGIWWDAPGAVTLVAASDLPVPGLPGVRYENVTLRELADAEHLFFTARLAGPEVDFTSDRALFVARRDGSVQVVLREGMRIDLTGAGGARTVETFRDGPVNKPLEKTLKLRFTDGSAAVFVARVGV